MAPRPHPDAGGLCSADRREGIHRRGRGLPDGDRQEATRSLLAVPGIGPWTAALVGLRGLADPDVWLPGDLALRRSLVALGSSDVDAATRWRPWRSYAVLHLWALAVPDLFTRRPPLDRSAP